MQLGYLVKNEKLKKIKKKYSIRTISNYLNPVCFLSFEELKEGVNILNNTFPGSDGLTSVI